MSDVFTQKWLKYALFIVGVGVIVAVYAVYKVYTTDNAPTLKNTVTITLTKDGFKPSNIIVAKGQTVTFITEKDALFWPASNQHPSHGELSGFDPKHPIEAKESWDFTFEKVGVWNFHDHFNAKDRGTVTVMGTDGGTKEECLDRSENGRNNIQPKCWEGEFNDALDRGGLAEAFILFKKYLVEDPLFQSNCHDVMHIVGDRAYTFYTQNGVLTTDEETVTCGFGFYHGFIERMTSENGSYTESALYCSLLQESSEFDSPVVATFAAINCRHGIGHAIFDSLESSTWGSGKKMMDSGIAICESIFTDEFERINCVSGISNALAIAYNNLYYGLSFEMNEHFSVCQNIPLIYQLYCFIEIGVHYANSTNLQPHDAYTLFKSVAGEAESREMVRDYITNSTQHQQNDTETLNDSKELCMSFRGNDQDVSACMFGTIVGLTRISEKETYIDLSSHYCSLFETHYKTMCAENMVTLLERVLTDAEMKMFCEKTVSRFNITCKGDDGINFRSLQTSSL